MITLNIILPGRNTAYTLMCISALLLFVQLPAHSQEPPPRPITIYVNPAQGLIFGAFSQGLTGGTVTIYPDGSRSVGGSVVQVSQGFPFSPAIFEVDANRGTLITIMNGPDVLLSGSNGGTISLQVGAASTGSTFVTTATSPARTEVRIGGILTIGNSGASPPGSYSGTFSVTFIQQ